MRTIRMGIVCLIVGLFVLISFAPTIMSEVDVINDEFNINEKSASIHFFKNIHGVINSFKSPIINGFFVIVGPVILNSDGDSMPLISPMLRIDTRGNFYIESTEYYGKEFLVIGFFGKITRSGNDPLRSVPVLDGLALITIVK